ncbi:MAG: protein kinase [Leptospiraceae bacterium]|nr:protein kinase [Leptospiraceae bacterium]
MQTTLQDRVFHNRYELREMLGEGSMGQVFRVWDRQAREDRALKLIDVRDRRFPLESILRFQNEAETVRSLRHSGIIRYIDFFNEDDLYGMVMEFLPGWPTLREVLDDNGPLAHQQAVRVLHLIAEAMYSVHEKGLVHHDLKSANILFNDQSDYQVKVLDFGLSHLVGAQGDRMAGTLAYMAPELTGMLNKIIDHRADLYSLGILLFEMLTGQLPFQANDPAILIHQHVASRPPRPAELDVEIPSALEAILFKLLSKDPEDRYRTTQGLLKDLDRYRRLCTEKDADAMNGFQPGEDDHWDSLPRENPFINRTREINHIQEIIAESTESGRSALILLEGARGIGKTRLMNAIHDRSKVEDGIVWFHSPRNEVSDIHYKALSSLFRNIIQFLKSKPAEEQTKLVQFLKKTFGRRFALVLELVPEMSNWLEQTDSTTATQNWQAEDYLSIYAAYIRIVAEYQKRLIVFIDDFSNVETSSAKVLLEANSKLKRSPVTFVFAYNHARLSDVQKDLLAEYEDAKGVHRVYLESLGEADCAALVQELFSGKLDQAARLIEPLYSACGGNPAILRQIIQSLVDARLIFYRDARWQYRYAEVLERIKQWDMHSTGDLLRNYTARDVHILRLGSVFERAFTLDALKTLCEQIPFQAQDETDSAANSAEEARNTLLTVLDRALLDSLLAVDSRRLYSFRDYGLKASLRRDLPSDIRMRAHGLIAHFLEGNVLPDSPEAIYDIAYHREQSGDFQATFHDYVNAARLTDNGAFTNSQAMVYYDLAVKTLDQLPEEAVDAETQFRIRYAALRHESIQHPRRRSLVEKAERMERWVGHNKAHRLQLLAIRANLNFINGNKEEMFRLGEELLALGSEPDDFPYVVETYIQLATVPSHKTYAERAELLKNGIEMALELKRLDLMSVALTIGVNMLCYLTRFKEAEDLINSVSRRIRMNKGEALFGKVIEVFPRAILAAEKGDFEAFHNTTRHIDTEIYEIGHTARRMLMSHIARTYTMVGQISEALQLFDKLLNTDEDTTQQGERALALHGRTLLAFRMNDPEGALEYIEQAMHHLQARPDAYMEGLFSVLAARAYMDLEQSEEALLHLEKAQAVADKLDSALLNLHLDFFRARAAFLEQRDDAGRRQGEDVLQRMFNAGVTGWYEYYRQDFRNWDRMGTDSSSSSYVGSNENRELIQLMQINRKITSTLEPDQLLSEVLDGAMKLTGAQHGYLFTCESHLQESMDAPGHADAQKDADLLNDTPDEPAIGARLLETDTSIISDSPNDSHSFQAKAHVLKLARDSRGKTIPESDYIYSTAILDEVLLSRKAVITRDARRERRWEHSDSVSRFALRSVLSVPIVLRNRNLGILYLDNHEASSVFSLRDREMVENFATQVAIAMNNAQVFEREKAARQQTEETLKIFERFVPRKFTERFAEGHVELLKTGLSRQDRLAILFSDLRDFTSLAESMTPGETFLLLNDYLNAMDAPIRRNRGFVDKFMGDAIMALFDGAPLTAVHAALEMLEELKRFNEHRRKSNLRELKSGIGINSGEVMLGVIGSAERMDTTVMGDVVNTAARIESLTKVYGANLLIGEDTYQGIKGETELYVRLVDRVQVKGKDRKTDIYEVFNQDSDAIIENKMKFRHVFEQAFELYTQAEWQKAEEAFINYQRMFPEDPVVLPFLDRCRIFQTLPPEDWTGVYRLDSK